MKRILYILILVPCLSMAQLSIDINSIENVSRREFAFIAKIKVKNFQKDYLYIKKKNQIIFSPLLYEQELDNVFDGFGFFLYTDSLELIKDIKTDIGIGDIVYFDKYGNLKFLYLEGVDNANIVKKRTTYYIKNKMPPFEEISIAPYSIKVLSIYVYIGRKKHIPEDLKYIKFYYKQNEFIEFSDFHIIKE